MMKKLVGLLAVAVTLSVGTPALAQRLQPQAKPARHVTIERKLAAPAWSAAKTAHRAPGNFEDTAPRPFAEDHY